MGIFSGRRGGFPSEDSVMRPVLGAAGEGGQARCDRCRVAFAKVEIITPAGSVFLCRHHLNEHHIAIIAAGYRIRASLEARA